MAGTVARWMCWLQVKATTEVVSFHWRNNWKVWTLPWGGLKDCKGLWEVRHILGETLHLVSEAQRSWLKEALRCTMIFSATLSWVGHAVKRNTAALFDGFCWQEGKIRTRVSKQGTTARLQFGQGITTKGLKNIPQVWCKRILNHHPS